MQEEWGSAGQRHALLRRAGLQADLRSGLHLRLYAHHGATLVGEVRLADRPGAQPYALVRDPLLRSLLRCGATPGVQAAFRQWGPPGAWGR